MFVSGKCSNCKDRKEYNDSFCSFCASHDYCSYVYNDKLPLYSFGVAKQLIFDCAMELEYNQSGYTNSEIAQKLLDINKELDKMRVIN